ncbi:hypothetical protein O0I10_008214 [Lichtheimia ornata]|uniref:Ubiquitin-like domain-containing protein n=1 Tax=Lichtheimia ornata TaxID=688661 RepID=A0AAD7V1Z3_9FUNG|nr:uncharacterized protein O0I10_008214 [Lichtheimia ornata]KAJ8656201.1 hypothetical protein O0I10_008214 [Lichtheimia ornata]
MLIVQGEDQYIKQYLEALSSRSVRYGKDYCSRQLPSSPRIKRKPNAPEEAAAAAATISTESPKIDVVIKVLKPASQLTITGISVNDTIEDLKERIAKQYGNGLTLNRQRLLLKGKALSDPKCLSEYNLTDKATLHLMITAAPASPASSPVVGRFGLSATADEKIKDPAFWDAIKSTVAQQLGGVDKDVDIVLEKMKSNLSQ